MNQKRFIGFAATVFSMPSEKGNNGGVSKYNRKDVMQAMIVKEWGPSLELLRVEALDRRLRSNHRMKAKVQLDLRRLRSGIKGEREVEYPLRFFE